MWISVQMVSAADEHAPFMPQPFCVYKGHSADLLDVSWSKVSLHHADFDFYCL